MTDERIKEEFEEWLKSNADMYAYNFASRYKKQGVKDAGYGFYAGFRAAERLAKIEVLEELDKLINSTGSKVATMQKISAMLSDLKGEQ